MVKKNLEVMLILKIHIIHEAGVRTMRAGKIIIINHENLFYIGDLALDHWVTSCIDNCNTTS